MPVCAVSGLAEVYPSNRVSELFPSIELHTGVPRKLQSAQDRKQIRKFYCLLGYANIIYCSIPLENNQDTDLCARPL